MSSVKQTFILKDKQLFEGETFDYVINEIGHDLEGDIEFRNCVFKKPVSFDKITISNKMYFFNCKFSGYSVIKNSKAYSISFNGCEFGADFKLATNKSSFLSMAGFKGEKLYINGLHLITLFSLLKLDKLTINDLNVNYTHLESRVEFNKDNKVKELNIKSSSLYSDFKINGTYESVFLRGTFNRNILLEENVLIENLFFESATFNGRVDFKGGNYNYVYFYRSSFLGIVLINSYDYLERTWKDLKIKDVTFHSNNFKESTSLTLLNVDSINLSGNTFQQIFSFNSVLLDMEREDYVNLSFDGTNQGTITISDVRADVSLSGINFGDFIFKDMEVSHLYINELKNNGKVSFSNIKPIGHFTIQNTTVGDTEFLNVDLNMFDEVVMSNSNLNGLNLSNYPNKVLSFSSNPKVGYGLDDKSKNNSNLRSIYNQLKKAAKIKGDVDTSVKYQSLEYKYLFREKKIGFDKILLLLNGLSNRSGKSWFRGVVFTLCVAFFAYWLYITVIGIELNKESWKDYIKFISSYPKLNLEKYEVSNSLWSVSLVVWLSRIFISYGIYQTVAAFRKYGKG